MNRILAFILLLIVSSAAHSDDIKPARKVTIKSKPCSDNTLFSQEFDLPQTPTFVENGFKSEIVYLSYNRVKEIWKLNHEISDVRKVYSREAARLSQEYILNKHKDTKCVDIYVYFYFN